MSPIDLTDARRRIAERVARAALLAFVLSGLGLATAAMIPIDVSLENVGRSDGQHMRLTTESNPAELGPLLVRLAGSDLIRPARLQAAVKDDGTAQRLAKQLRLQGIVQSDDTHVAYIQVEKQKLEVVREGDTILEFTVEEVEPHRVTLSLRGVTVTLSF